MNSKSPLLLIGAGPMAIEYVKVLTAQNIDFITIGRGEKSASDFELQTGLKVIRGGLKKFLNDSNIKPDRAIVATGVDKLAPSTLLLIESGAKNILCEKPGGLSLKELNSIKQASEKTNCDVYIAYNRRFYASVLEAGKLIKKEGGVSSFNFEFTEWSHRIQVSNFPKIVLANWFVANSSHVVDLAFFMGGKPEVLNCHSKGSLEWHTRSSVFAGSGKTNSNALFSYQANWAAPGRWALEFLTTKHRYIFKPMEQLHVTGIGSVSVDKIDVDDAYDQKFKPGLFLQTKEFLTDSSSRLCTISEQIEMMSIYLKIANY